MADVLKKALQLLVGSPNNGSDFKVPKKGLRPFKTFTERDLIKLESEIGSQLFGPVPAGNQREFFNLDANTWIWYEEWVDADTGKKKTATTRYEVHDESVLKVQEGAHYSYLEGKELENLTVAIHLYYELVMREIYKRDPKTGKKLA